MGARTHLGMAAGPPGPGRGRGGRRDRQIATRPGWRGRPLPGIRALALAVLPAAGLVGAAAAPSHAQAALAGRAPSPRVATIVWGGDVHFGRAVAEAMAERQSDPLGAVAPILAPADLRVVNLEGPLTTAPRAVWGYDLTGSPDSATPLADAGIDIVTVANNHATDHGPAGLVETLDGIREAGILAVGGGTLAEAYAPLVVKVGDLEVAFLAFNRVFGGAPATSEEAGVAVLDDRLTAAVRSARGRADLVFVLAHWGVEYVPVAGGHQRAAARALARAGADAVIGHHPHVVQDVEWLPRRGRRPTLVAYSVGNLLFDALAPDAQRGALLWTHADRFGVARFRADPIRTNWLGTAPSDAASDREALIARLLPSPALAMHLDEPTAGQWFAPPPGMPTGPIVPPERSLLGAAVIPR